MLDRLSKLVLLFFSAGNPVWEHLVETPNEGDGVPAKKQSITQQKVAKAALISQSTLGNWKKGGAIDLKNLDEAFDTIVGKIENAKISEERRQQLIASVKGFRAECLDPNARASVYDVARGWLSIPMDDCQKILDEIIYDTFTLLPSLSYGDKSAADQNLKKYAGLYLLYLKRHRRLWLKCPLRVRYVVKSGARYVIRCKLNAPKLRPEPDAASSYMEYDGFLRTADDNVYWKFEKRDAVNVDFLDYITDEGKLYRTDDGGAVRILSGRYLTVGQDPLHTMEDGDVIMEGVLPEQIAGAGYETLSQTEKDAAIVRWMHETAGVLEQGTTTAEWDRVNQLWKKFGVPSRNRDAIKPLGD